MLGRSTRPEFRNLTPYIFVEKVEPVIQFAQDAFGAEVHYQTTGSAGGQHVELKIGDSMIMLGGNVPGGMEAKPAAFFLYVEDTDAVYESALDAGATTMMEPDRNFEEKRGAGIVDPFGNMWFIATHDPNDTGINL